MKAAWIFRGDDFTINMIQSVIPEELGNTFWDSSLKVVDVRYCLSPNTPKFWIQVCEAWFEVASKSVSQLDASGILFQILWCNSDIRSDGNVWMPEDAAKKASFTLLI